MKQSREVLLALLAGMLLVGIVSFNSQLAKATTPLFASWVAHGVGTLVSILFLLGFLHFFPPLKTSTKTVPWWGYAGGLAGAMTVAVASMAVNSPLGLAGTLALSLVGQISFSLVSDQFGWFGLLKRKLTIHDFISISLVVTGSLFIIYFQARS